MPVSTKTPKMLAHAKLWNAACSELAINNACELDRDDWVMDTVTSRKEFDLMRADLESFPKHTPDEQRMYMLFFALYFGQSFTKTDLESGKGILV